jgi:hypothetical protein
MRIEEKLEPKIRLRLEHPKSVGELPTHVYLVYILTVNQTPIVVGHGKKNRAKVIFDSIETITPHIKALVVRLHILFGGSDAIFERFIIRCKSKEEAKEIEVHVHATCGGNTLALPQNIEAKLLDGITPHSPEWMALRMAVCSSFDGISDLRRWNDRQIFEDKTWKEICAKLKLG